jgi:hypothetical protein
MRTIFAIVLFLSIPAVVTAGPLDQSDVFRPDVYPSQRAAAAGLAKRLVGAMSGAKQFDPEKSVVQLVGDVDPDALTTFANTLRDEFPALRVENQPASTGAIRVELHLLAQEPIASQFRTRRDLTRGTVSMTASGGGVDQSDSVRYVDKPWMDDWETFSNAETKGRWIRAQSEIPVPTEAEAMKRALAAASKELWPRVRQQMNARNAARPGAIKVGEEWVRARLEARLRQGEHVTDRFIQTYQRPYGQVWQISILVDASSDDINEMARHCASLARAEFGAKAVTFGSIAGLFGVILLLYFLVNAVTRGYFLWRLRAAALLLGIAGILIVLAVT